MENASESRTPAMLRMALVLAYITVVYNIAEGIVSCWFGFEDETIALFGFGVDSFVEVVSGLGILHMVMRIKAHRGSECPDRFEATALRVTGWSFYALAVGLAATGAYNIATRHAPEATFWGIIVSVVSIATMWWLVNQKVKVGRALGSDAILADAACTRTCMRLSIVLLASSVAFELTGVGIVDSVGGIVIAWQAWQEGREAMGKAEGKACSCSA